MYYSLYSDNGSREVLHYFSSLNSVGEKGWTVYDCHVAYEITYFVDMEGTYTIEGKDYEIQEGDIFILPSNVKHRMRRIVKGGMLENLYFDPAFIWQESDAFDLNYINVFNMAGSDYSYRLDRNNPACETVRTLISAIRTEFEQEKYGYAHMVKMNLFTILLTLIRDFGYCSGDVVPHHIPHVESIRNTMRYIDDHLSEPLNMQLLSGIANLSTNYYGTLFKQLNGITPVEYITSKRVIRAIGLLPDFKGTMLELALACGFNNTANFNRAFRSFTGQVPSKYIPPVI